MNLSNPNVLIVGGGHVGLSFALLLAHHGIKSTLVEHSRYPVIEPEADTARTHYLDARNTALSRRTVQIYQEIEKWIKENESEYTNIYEFFIKNTSKLIIIF